MKKKLFGLLLLVLVFGVTGCGEKGEIYYNGIYELDNTQIRTYLKDSTIYYKVENETLDTYGNAELNKEKNVVKLDSISDDAKLTFKNDKISIKTSNEYLESKDYKYTKPYSKEEFYNDFYGDKKYLNSKINGIYEKDDIKIYVYQNRDEAIRIYFDLNEGTNDFEVNLTEDKTYQLDFFDTIFNISFAENTMTMDVQVSEDYEEYDVLNGTYEKTSALNLDKILEYIPVP